MNYESLLIFELFDWQSVLSIVNIVGILKVNSGN